MDTGWDPNLIVDSGWLRSRLFHLFDDKFIQMKVNVCGLGNNDWVFAQWPVDKWCGFKFAINILPGRFVILFVESDDRWLTKEWEQLLIKWLESEFKHGVEVVSCGEGPRGFGWFNQDYQKCKERTVADLLQGYKELW